MAREWEPLGGQFAVVPLLALAMSSCSGSAEDTHSSPGVDGYCSAERGWQNRCPGTNANEPPCGTYGAACLERIFRPDGLTKMTECAQKLACDANIDDCGEDLISPDPLPSATAFSSECQARLTACEGQLEDQFFCFDLSAHTEAYIAVFRACLNEPCTSIRGCEDQGKFASFCAM